MNKKEELEKLEKAIKDGEIRLNTIKNNVDILDKEINTLTHLEVQLEANLKCLKKKNIVAMASEFKKAKEDLKKTRVRMIVAKNEREDFKKATEATNYVIAKAKEDIEKVKNFGENNVLYAIFRRKKNGQE